MLCSDDLARVFCCPLFVVFPAYFFACFFLQGNFAQFLESADSVVSLTASEAGSGSFVNLFALAELKVGRDRDRTKKQKRRTAVQLAGC